MPRRDFSRDIGPFLGVLSGLDIERLDTPEGRYASTSIVGSWLRAFYREYIPGYELNEQETTVMDLIDPVPSWFYDSPGMGYVVFRAINYMVANGVLHSELRKFKPVPAGYDYSRLEKYMFFRSRDLGYPLELFGDLFDDMKKVIRNTPRRWISETEREPPRSSDIARSVMGTQQLADYGVDQTQLEAVQHWYQKSYYVFLSVLLDFLQVSANTREEKIRQVIQQVATLGGTADEMMEAVRIGMRCSTEILSTVHKTGVPWDITVDCVFDAWRQIGCALGIGEESRQAGQLSSLELVNNKLSVLENNRYRITVNEDCRDMTEDQMTRHIGDNRVHRCVRRMKKLLERTYGYSRRKWDPFLKRDAIVYGTAYALWGTLPPGMRMFV